MTDNEVLAGPESKVGLALCIVFYILSGWFVGYEYFIIRAEVESTSLVVFFFLVSWFAGVGLSVRLLTPLSKKHRILLGNILGIVLLISVLGFFSYISLRVL